MVYIYKQYICSISIVFILYESLIYTNICTCFVFNFRTMTILSFRVAFQILVTNGSNGYLYLFVIVRATRERKVYVFKIYIQVMLVRHKNRVCYNLMIFMILRNVSRIFCDLYSIDSIQVPTFICT